MNTVSVLGRSSQILRHLARTGNIGAATTDIARAIDIPRPTIHRQLNQLLAEGFVDRDRHTGEWFLGAELYLLGAAAANRYDITTRARASVRRLAASTGESAFLSVRRGPETVCLIREDGSFPVRSHVLHEGIRFPLGVASAGLAILAFLPDREIHDHLEQAQLEYDWGPHHSNGEILQRIQQVRTRGCSLNPGLIVEGSWGMAAAVFDSDGSPQWALSLTGIETRFAAQRQPVLIKLLLDEAHALARHVQGHGSQVIAQAGDS